MGFFQKKNHHSNYKIKKIERNEYNNLQVIKAIIHKMPKFGYRSGRNLKNKNKNPTRL
jgi:hypothetical protein